MIKLNISLVACGLLAAIAGAVSAAEGEQPSTWMTPSVMSRADVRAEAQAAAAIGKLAGNEAGYTVTPAASDSPLMRAQIAAETREMVRLRLLPKHDSNRVATAADLEQVRQAGLRAVERRMAAAK